jgi:hypothetical protein
VMDANSLVGTVFPDCQRWLSRTWRTAGRWWVVTTRTRDVVVPCPVCGTTTAEVHGYHRRTVKVVPVDGRQAVVQLRVRRLVPAGTGRERNSVQPADHGRGRRAVGVQHTPTQPAGGLQAEPDLARFHLELKDYLKQAVTATLLSVLPRR